MAELDFYMEETGASLEDAKKALEDAGGDLGKAIDGFIQTGGVSLDASEKCDLHGKGQMVINDDCVATAKCAETAVCTCYSNSVKVLEGKDCGGNKCGKICEEQVQFCTGPEGSKTPIDWCTEPPEEGLSAGIIILIAVGGLLVVILIPVVIGMIRAGKCSSDPEKPKKKKIKQGDLQAYSQWGMGAVQQQQPQMVANGNPQAYSQWGQGAVQQQQPQMVATGNNNGNPQAYSQWGQGAVQQQQQATVAGRQQTPYAQQQKFTVNNLAQGQQTPAPIGQGYGGWQGTPVTPQPNPQQGTYGGWQGNAGTPQRNPTQGQAFWPAAASGSTPMQYPIAVSGKQTVSKE